MANFKVNNNKPDIKFNAGNYKSMKTMSNSFGDKQKKIEAAVSQTQQEINEKIANLLQKIEDIFKES